MKYVLLYESADDVATKAPQHGPTHDAHCHESHSRGDLLMIGPFTNAQDEGAMAVFTSREAAEGFASTDPFVLNGVVKSWTVREWNEVLA